MQNDDQNNKLELLSIGEASEYLGISIDTLRRWEKKGRIEPLRSPGGHRYYNKKSLEELFGKRYTRDEETIRVSGQKEGVGVIDQNAVNKINSAEVVTIIEPKEQLSPVGLPAWRTFRQTEVTEELEVTMGTPVSNSPVAAIPSRDIKIPETKRISIISTRTENTIQDTERSTQEAYFKQQTASILTPADYKNSTVSYSNIKNDIATSSEKASLNENVVSAKANKKIVAVLLFIIGSIILSLTWYSLWQKSQIILSPVP